MECFNGVPIRMPAIKLLNGRALHIDPDPKQPARDLGSDENAGVEQTVSQELEKVDPIGRRIPAAKQFDREPHFSDGITDFGVRVRRIAGRQIATEHESNLRFDLRGGSAH
jgi:hypothetical protein